jgi:hypothetical protein
VARTAAGEWRIQPKLGVPYNLCLDIEGGGVDPGARLQQYTCKTIDVENQRFLAVPQQQEPAFLGCASALYLRLGTIEGSLTLYQTDIANSAGRTFGYGCGIPSTPVPYTCPLNTNLIEISRNYADQFRVKCGRN